MATLPVRRGTTIPPVQPQYRTKGEIVVERLRDLIQRGVLTPGEWVDQRQLAEQLGVSRLLVREALTRLQGEGIVRFAPHRGAYVIRLTAEELEDLYLVRITLERTAVELAVPRLTDEMIQAMRHAVDDLERAFAGQEIDAFFGATQAFYDVAYRASGARALCDLIHQLRNRCRPYIYAYWSMDWSEHAAHSLRGIRRLLESLERRDTELAVAIVTNDLLGRVVESLGSYLRQPRADRVYYTKEE